MRGRFFQIKEVLSHRLYFFLFIFFSLFYIGIYYGIIRFFFYGLQTFFVTYRPSYVYPAIFLNFMIALLVGTNISLLVFWIKEIRSLGSGGSVAGFFGIFAAALANGCPGCIAGLFPLFLSLFGITASLSILPFNGLELQAASVLLLGTSIFFLSGQRRLVCPANITVSKNVNFKRR